MDNRSFLSGAAGSAPTAPGSPSVGYPTGGNPGTATPPTNPGPFWFHAIGEELRNVIVAGGLTPTQGTLTQLKSALDAIYGNVLSSAGVPYGFKIGSLIVQVASVAFADVPVGVPGGSGSVTWTTAFPTACLFCFPSTEVTAGNASNFSVSITAKSTTGADFQIQEWSAAANPGTLRVLAFGY